MTQSRTLCVDPEPREVALIKLDPAALKRGNFTGFIPAH